MYDLVQIAQDFAQSLKLADAKRPQAINVRSKQPFRPGIGPHTEAQTVALVASEMEALRPRLYRGKVATAVPYPDLPRQKCDLCLGTPSTWEWAIEVKMLRLLGDNGKLNDNLLMHILSPYPAHRSALTDCEKLVGSLLGASKAVVIYGYDHSAWPLELAITAFESLARTRVILGPRQAAAFGELVHPVHSNGRVFAWELKAPA